MQPAKATRQDAHSLLTTATAAILGFALNLVTARFLGPAGKGTLDLAGASAGLLALAFGFSLNAGLTQYVAANQKAPASIARNIWLWSGLAGLLSAGLFLGFPSLCAKLGVLPPDNTVFWASFIIGATMLGIASASLRGVLIGRGGLITANRIDILIKLLLLLAYLGAALLLTRPDAVLFACAALPALALLPLLLHFAQRGPVHAGPGIFHTIIVATLPLHGANLIHFLNQRADLFFVQAYHGSAEVGIYALAVSLAQTVLFLSSALAVPLLPQVAAEVDGRKAVLSTSACCRRFVLLGGIASVVLGTASYWMVPILFGRDFSLSLTPLLLLLPGMIAFGLTNLLISYFAGTGQNRLNLVTSMLGLVLTVAGNLTLTRLLGATGAAAVSTLSYGLMAFVSLWIFTRRSGLPLLQAVIPDRETLRSCFLMLAHMRP